MSTDLASLVTAEELNQLPDDGRQFEIVEGVLVEVPPVGAYECSLEFMLAHFLQNYLDSGRASGVVLPATARYRLRRNPDTVRGPDVSFIRAERLSPGPLPSGHLDLVPDLAVEIVSESNPSQPIERKVSEYLDAGVKMIWVIYPESRTAYLYGLDGSVQRIGKTGELDGGDALPGFRLPLAKLFEAVGVKSKS